MVRDLHSDLNHLSSLAFRRKSHPDLLKKFHQLKKQIDRTEHPHLIWNIYDWLLVPLSLWPLDFEGLAHYLLDSVDPHSRRGNEADKSEFEVQSSEFQVQSSSPDPDNSALRTLAAPKSDEGGSAHSALQNPMIVIPRHWSLDPRRDLDWPLINRLHRSRGAKKQGPKLSPGRIQKLDDAKKVRTLREKARKLKLKGEQLHDFMCREMHREPRASAQGQEPARRSPLGTLTPSAGTLSRRDSGEEFRHPRVVSGRCFACRLARLCDG